MLLLHQQDLQQLFSNLIMKKLLSVALFCLTVGLAACHKTVVTPIQPLITFQWQSNGNPGTQICSTTVQTRCLIGYEIVDISTNPPTTIASSISAVDLFYTWTAIQTSGIHVYQLIAIGQDNNSMIIYSNPAQTTLIIP
jgi:hypothetical protein